MAYFEQRLTRFVVLVRLVTGGVFAVLGWSKLASLEVARPVFADFLAQALDGGAAGWYAGILRSMVGVHPGRLAGMVGLVELMIGLGLLLGLAVRPMCGLGILYMLNLMLATWNAPEPAAPLWRFLQAQAGHVFPLLVFVLLGVAHAGEHWGLGAVYHRRRLRREERLAHPQPARAPEFAEEEAEEPVEAQEHEAEVTR